MIAAGIVTILVTALLAALGPRLARQLRPATAVIALTASALAAATGYAYVLAALAFLRIAEVPGVAEHGDWSATALQSMNPVPLVVAGLSGAALAAGAAGLAWSAIAQFRAHRCVRRMVGTLAHTNGVILVPSARANAFATPAAGGRVIVTTGLLDALDRDETRALLAHERAHLRLRHHWWTIAANICAAACPLLRPVATAVAESVERWADESAAWTVGDRRIVARALARAALISNGATPRRPAGMLAAISGGQTPRRVSALLAPPPQRRLAPLAGLFLLLASLTIATGVTGVHADDIMDSATVGHHRVQPADRFARHHLRAPVPPR
jgi:hypothetical protein